MRHFILIIVAIVLALPASAQKKQIREAEDIIKSGKNLEKAEQSMEKLLADSANRQNTHIWALLIESLKGEYEQGNEKLYLKQKYDTAAFFKLGYKLFGTAQKLDSVEMWLAAHGKGKVRNRKKNASYLMPIRQNLYYGGLYFMAKKQFDDAYNFLDRYIDLRNETLFAHQPINDDLKGAAYGTVYCGLKLGDANKALRYFDIAAKDTAHAAQLIQMRAETAELQQDTAAYANWLSKGFNAYPSFHYFFPRLIDYYTSTGDNKKAMEVTEKALNTDPENTIFLFTKSNLLLNSGDYDSCIAISDTLIARGETMPDIYYNAGLAYFDKAIEIDKNRQPSRQKLRIIQQLYRKALPYLEKYRAMAPNQSKKWSLPLYTIYLNLNMGDEFDEINKIISKQK